MDDLSPETRSDPALLRALVDHSPDAVFAKDRDGLYVLVNPEAARMLGLTAAKIIGKDDTAILGADRAATTRAIERRALETGQAEVLEEQFDTPAGPRTYRVTRGPMQDARGRLSGYFGIGTDITAWAAERQGLKESEARYRVLFKASPLPMWAYSLADGRILAVNRAAEALYGYPRDRFIQLHPTDLHPPSAGPGRHRHADGRVLEVEVAEADVQIDGEAARMVHVSDVSARRLAETQLQSAAERFKKLFDAAPDAISLSELASGRFLQVNEAFCSLFGHTAEQVIGRTSAELGLWTHPEGRAAVVETLRAGGSVRDFEGVAIRRDGSRIDVAFNAERVDVDGQECLMLVFRDVTKRKADVAALRHSEQRFRLAAAGGQVWEWDFGAGDAFVPTEFFARLGHELDGRSLQQAFEAIVPPEDLADIRRNLTRHLKRQGPYRVQFRATDAQGQVHWFETQGQAVWDQHDRATYIAGTTFEITKRRQAEQSLLDSQAELFALAQQLLQQEQVTNRRLAQALHDQLGQTLGSARLHLDLLREALGDPPPAVEKTMDRLSKLLELSVAEVRSTLATLRPPVLESQGLVASLSHEVDDLRSGHPELAFDFAPSPGVQALRWPDEVEYAAFMIAREALANVIRHANAHRVRVRLTGASDRLRLLIVDDGIGIDAGSTFGREGHLGIVGMRERALGIGARLVVQGGPDSRGTEVRVEWWHSWRHGDGTDQAGAGGSGTAQGASARRRTGSRR